MTRPQRFRSVRPILSTLPSGGRNGTPVEIAVCNPWAMDRPLEIKCQLEEGMTAVLRSGKECSSWLTLAGELLLLPDGSWKLDRYTETHVPDEPIVQEAAVRGWVEQF